MASRSSLPLTSTAPLPSSRSNCKEAGRGVKMLLCHSHE